MAQGKFFQNVSLILSQLTEVYKTYIPIKFYFLRFRVAPRQCLKSPGQRNGTPRILLIKALKNFMVIVFIN